MNDKSKMNCTFFWLLWIFIVILVVQIKYFLLRGANADIVFLLFAAYSIPTWIMIGILSWIKCSPAIKYLEKNKYADLSKSYKMDLNHIDDIPHKYKKMRIEKFLISRYSIGDYSIKILKDQCRWYMILKWTLLVTYPIILVILLYIP